MSAALREILAVFGVEVDDKELKKGEKGIEGFKKTLGEFGTVLAEAFAIKEIVEFGREILEQADVLAKQSQALSVSAAKLQGWQFAAKLSGSSAEEFNSAFTKFNKNVAEAGKGSGPAADALKALGFSAEDVKNKLPIDMLDQVADGLVKIQNPAKRTEAVLALFGKSGARLLPLFLEGAEGTKKLRAEVKELGAEFDEAFLEEAQEVNDNIDRLKLGFRGLAIQALKPLLPLITEWTKNGVVLIKQLVTLLTHSNALKVGLVVFGSVGAAKAIAGMVKLAQKAGFLKNGLRGLLLEVLPLVAAFIVLEDVFTFLTGGDSVTGDLIEKFFGKDAPEKVKQFAAALKDAGISDAMMLVGKVFEIFTDGKPLDTKFKELLAFIDGEFLAQMKKDFGGVGAQITLWLNLLTGVLGVLNQIISAMGWIADHTIKAVGSAVFNAEDAAANEDARRDRRKADGDPSWYDSLRNLLAPSQKDVSAAVDRAQRAPGTSQFATDTSYLRQPTATAPVPPAPIQSLPPVVKNTTTVNQYITADTPSELKRAARDGAKDGVNEGNNQRTMRVLVPTP